MGRMYVNDARRRVGLTAALLASTALSAVPAWAQDAAPAKPASGPIERVTVTAQTRHEPMAPRSLW